MSVVECKVLDTTTVHNETWRTHKPSPGASEMSSEKDSGLDPRQHHFEIPTGYDVFRWPEFQALAKRLMIDLEAPTKCITIRVHCDEIMQITHETQGLDADTPILKGKESVVQEKKS